MARSKLRPAMNKAAPKLTQQGWGGAAPTMPKLGGGQERRTVSQGFRVTSFGTVKPGLRFQAPPPLFDFGLFIGIGDHDNIARLHACRPECENAWRIAHAAPQRRHTCSTPRLSPVVGGLRHCPLPTGCSMAVVTISLSPSDELFMLFTRATARALCFSQSCHRWFASSCGL